MSMTATMTFKKEKETKNAVRYQEQTVNDVTPAKIGALYVQKATFAEHGSIPDTITVTVTVD